MTTEQTAQQLELAAQILRTGHPFEVRHDTSDRWHASLGVNPAQAVLQNWCLRPVLATPPDNRPLHNPDNLTAEQVGVGYRLALPGESAASPHDFWDGNTWRKAKLLGPAIFAWCCRSCRLPLSVPWPEPEKPDPYAELKAAHATGKVIQWFDGTTWIDLIKPVDPNPLWLHPAKDLRIKPEEPSFTLPPAPPGMRWHREDGWTADDLPSGYRPLVVGEKYVSGDEYRTKYSKDWHPETFLGTHTGSKEVTQSESSSLRTTRPLVFNHAGKTWTYHRPGDPMPCDGERMVHILTRDNDFSKEPSKAEDYEWNQIEGSGRFAEILGWRYAEPQTKTVPLGPEDVPPGSVFAVKDRIANTWHGVLGTYATAVELDTQKGTYTYNELASDCWQINRSIPLTGKWNPDAWEPCSKQIPV